jgi:hypothetical protein
MPVVLLEGAEAPTVACFVACDDGWRQPPALIFLGPFLCLTSLFDLSNFPDNRFDEFCDSTSAGISHC